MQWKNTVQINLKTAHTYMNRKHSMSCHNKLIFMDKNLNEHRSKLNRNHSRLDWISLKTFRKCFFFETCAKILGLHRDVYSFILTIFEVLRSFFVPFAISVAIPSVYSVYLKSVYKVCSKTRIVSFKLFFPAYYVMRKSERWKSIKQK